MTEKSEYTTPTLTRIDQSDVRFYRALEGKVPLALEYRRHQDSLSQPEPVPTTPIINCIYRIVEKVLRR